MRILHVVHGYPPEQIGGTELYVSTLARAQRAAGHDVRVFAGSMDWGERFFVSRGDVDGVPVVRAHRDDLYFDRWDKGYCPRVSFAFQDELGAFAPDVVHLHHWIRLSSDLVRTAARRSIPVVVTLHDLFPTCPRVFRLKDAEGHDACESPVGAAPCVPCVPRWRFQRDEEIERLLAAFCADVRAELEAAAAVIAPTSGHGAFLTRMLGLESLEITTLPHGSLASRELGPAAPSTDGRIHLASWGHLQPLKGVHVLLDAVRRSRRRSRFHVDVFGAAADGAYRGLLDELAAGSSVDFHGAFSAKDLAKHPIDVAVIPTLCRESYSFIVDEAAALGVPIVASDFGAIQDRATERLIRFRRDDPADLARVLDGIVDDPARLERARAAPAPARASIEEHVARLEAIYRTVRPPAPTALVSEVDALRARLVEQWDRRETAFRELVRTETWEDVVAELRRRIAELEQ